LHKKKQDRDTNQDGTTRFTNLFVKHLDKGTTDAQLRQIFEPFGEIDSIKVQIGSDGEVTD
jgi:RNA recognition motif-containing protein